MRILLEIQFSLVHFTSWRHKTFFSRGYSVVLCFSLWIAYWTSLTIFKEHRDTRLCKVKTKWYPSNLLINTLVYIFQFIIFNFHAYISGNYHNFRSYIFKLPFFKQFKINARYMLFIYQYLDSDTTWLICLNHLCIIIKSLKKNN